MVIYVFFLFQNHDIHLFKLKEYINPERRKFAKNKNDELVNKITPSMLIV